MWDISCEISHVRYLMWDISCEISHVRYLMWDIPCEISHVRYLMWDISCEISHVRYLYVSARPPGGVGCSITSSLSSSLSYIFVEDTVGPCPSVRDLSLGGNIIILEGYGVSDATILGWIRHSASPTLHCTALHCTTLHSCTQALMHSGTPAIQNSGTRHSGTQALRHSGTQALRHSGTQALRHTGTHALRHSGIQAFRHSGTQALRHSGTHALRHSCNSALRHSALRYSGNLGTPLAHLQSGFQTCFLSGNVGPLGTLYPVPGTVPHIVQVLSLFVWQNSCKLSFY
jgi:hypothetical protein